MDGGRTRCTMVTGAVMRVCRGEPVSAVQNRVILVETHTGALTNLVIDGQGPDCDGRELLSAPTRMTASWRPCRMARPNDPPDSDPPEYPSRTHAIW